jgi:hypothetical protein
VKRLGGYVLVVLSVAFGLLLLPCVQKVSDSDRLVPSQHTLKVIGGAFLTYHETFKRFPPAVVTDPKGRPLCSWRVLLLPFLEEGKLYRQFHLDEPWDSADNKKLLEQTPWCYVPRGGGQDEPGLTRYQVLVGPGTAFERPRPTLKDMPDGPENTILVVEAAKAVPWSKPVDLAYDPKGPLPALGGVVSQPVHFLCNEVSSRPGFNAAFADGKVRFIRGDTDERTIRALITRNGGEKVDASTLD